MTQGRQRWLALGIAVCVIGGGAAYWMNRPEPAAPGLSPFNVVREARTNVPVLFEAPPFDFVDQNGKPLQNTSLKGRIWIADFIFTHCAGTCPQVTARFVELQKQIDDPEVRFISFSVDPARDDPATLKGYATNHNKDEQRWLLLRPPDQAAIRNVAQRMMAMAGSSDAHDAILHTDFFSLIDHKGRMRGVYDSKDGNAIERLKSDFAIVARERIADLNPDAAGKRADG